MNQHEEQKNIDRAICDAMVLSVPDNWNTIILTIERFIESNIGELSHSISSPEGFIAVMPDDSLYDATFELDKLFDRNGKRFTNAIYTVTLYEDSWKYKAEFSYEPPRVNALNIHND